MTPLLLFPHDHPRLPTWLPWTGVWPPPKKLVAVTGPRLADCAILDVDGLPAPEMMRTLGSLLAREDAEAIGLHQVTDAEPVLAMSARYERDQFELPAWDMLVSLNGLSVITSNFDDATRPRD